MSNTGVRHSRQKKQQAVLLRTSGWSVKGIAKRLRIAVSTASVWVRHIPLSEKHQEQLMAINGVAQGQTARDRALARTRQWQQEARTLWAQWCCDPLFMLGLGIYWGEGTKSYRRLAVTNSDAAIVQAWVRWCRRYIPEAVLRVSVTFPLGADAEAVKQFWRKTIGVERIAAYPNRRVPLPSNYRRNRVLPHGTAQVRVGRTSAEWHTKMMEWLKLLAEST